MASNRERQTLEFEVIESIFGDDVEDLRPVQENQNWKPLNFRINNLTPLQGGSSQGHGPSEIYVRLALRFICSAKYPKAPPKVSVEQVA